MMAHLPLLETMLVAIGLAPDHKRAAFCEWTSDSIVNFATQHDFASMYENLKEYDGAKYTSPPQCTFRLMPAEKTKILVLIHWAHTVIAQGVDLDVANFNNPVTIWIWSQCAKEVLELIKHKSNIQSRVEDNFLKIEPACSNSCLSGRT